MAPKPSAECAERMADFFDERAAGYDEHMAQSVHNFEVFYTAVAKPISRTQEALRILDIGCGTGLELASIFDRVPMAHVTAVDLSGEMLARLRRKYVEILEYVTLVHSSYLDVDFGDNAYDVAVAVMTLHHLLAERKRRLYQKIHRALRNGGTYIEGDYMTSPEQEQRLVAEYREKVASIDASQEGMYHVDIPFSVETQRSLLLEAGFKSVETVWQAGEAAILVAEKSTISSGQDAISY